MNTKEFVEFSNLFTKVFVYEDSIEIKSLGRTQNIHFSKIVSTSITGFGRNLEINTGSIIKIKFGLSNKEEIKRISDYLNGVIKFDDLKEIRNTVNNDHKKNHIDLFSRTLGNILGVIFIISSFSFFDDSFIVASMIFLTGVLITSFGYKFLKSKLKFNLSKNQRIFIALILLSVGSSTLSLKTFDNFEPSGDTKIVEEKIHIGDEGYLKLGTTTDPDQVICLGSTKEEHEQISKALIAKDYIGILEIPGAFCVGNGTKIQVIDTDYMLRRVRIIETHRDVDQDKLLMSGWVTSDFVSE
jgi:hypothetical protein